MKTVFLNFIVLCFALLSSATAFAEERLKAGQVWETNSADGIILVSLIQRIEPYGNGNVIHITPIEYEPSSGQMFVLVSHMPFDENAFNKSVTTLLDKIEPDESIYLDGYNEWKSNEGGIFTVSIYEAIQSVNTALLDPNSVSMGDYIHETLPEELYPRIKATTDVFENIDGISYEQAIDLYRRDVDPEANLIIFEEMARVFTLFCQDNCQNDEKKKEVYSALLIISMFQQNKVITQLNPEILSASEVENLITLYSLAPIPIGVVQE